MCGRLIAQGHYTDNHFIKCIRPSHTDKPQVHHQLLQTESSVFSQQHLPCTIRIPLPVLNQHSTSLCSTTFSYHLLSSASLPPLCLKPLHARERQLFLRCFHLWLLATHLTAMNVYARAEKLQWHRNQCAGPQILPNYKLVSPPHLEHSTTPSNSACSPRANSMSEYNMY